MKETTTEFSLAFAGVCVRIRAPLQLEIPWDLQPFVSDVPNADATYDVQLLSAPLSIAQAPIFNDGHLQVYRQGDDWLRVYSYLKDENGCCAALKLAADGHHALFLPAGDIDRYRLKCVLSPVLGLEHVLMQHKCYILHSSVVVYQGRAVLFCGASGAGKSTQADLWANHLGAKIINGDRCAVSVREDGFYGCGSPFSGSSEIYTAEEAPIAAIVFVHQGTENQLSPAHPLTAFTTLYAQTAANTWNSDYTKTVCDLLERTVSGVPLYDLTCRPDQGAVEILRQTLFPNNQGGCV